MVHLVEVGRREFSVVILAGCRSPFTESTPTALGLSQPEVVYTSLKMQNESWKTRHIPRRTQNTPRNPQQAGDRDHLETACDETRPTC